MVVQTDVTVTIRYLPVPGDTKAEEGEIEREKSK